MGAEEDSSLVAAPGLDQGVSADQPRTAAAQPLASTSPVATSTELPPPPPATIDTTVSHEESTTTAPASANVEDRQQNGNKGALVGEVVMASGELPPTISEPTSAVSMNEDHKASYLGSAAYLQPANPPTTTTQQQHPAYTSPTYPPESYRANNGSVPLPSMRTMEPQQQNVHQGLQPALQYMAQQPMGHLPSNYGLPSDTYGMHDDPRMRHGQGKKEIKRRTKTGCLTCRKRRIKCDEAHPTCNNCRKSKRDCLGYDPIFRPQTVNLVSAYNQQPPEHTSSSDAPPPSQPLLPDVSAGENPLENSYGSQPNSYTHPGVSNGVPALVDPSIPIKTDLGLQPSSSIPPTIKQEFQSAPHIPPLTQPEPNTRHNLPSTTTSGTPGYYNNHTHLRATKMKIEGILDLLGPLPPAQNIVHSEETLHEVTKVYHEMYAGALSAFFETNWYYFSEGGKISFPTDKALIEALATFLKILEGIKANDQHLMTYSGALETRIVWQLASTAATASEGTNNSMRMALPPEGDAIEAKNRLQVVEALLCGDYLASNPLTTGLSDNDSHRMRQFDFWYQLGDFLRRPDPSLTPAAAAKAREDTLNRMRHLLDGRENRDVLYSVAVVRELSPYFPGDYANTVPQHLDETDPKNRLAVASKFILDESQITGGTTNVVRRFSDIAARAFIVPGVNIAKH